MFGCSGEYKEEQEDTLAQKSDKMKTSKKETSKIDKEGVDNPEVTMERNETEVIVFFLYICKLIF